MNIVNTLIDSGINDDMVQGMVIIDDMDEAVVGYVENNDHKLQLVYDYNKILDIFIKRDNMTYDEAMEFVDYNFHFSEEQKPLIMYTMEEWK